MQICTGRFRGYIMWVLTRVTGDDTCVGADRVRRRTLEHDFIARSRVIIPRVVGGCRAGRRELFAWSTRTHVNVIVIIWLLNNCFYKTYLNWARIVWKHITFTWCVHKIPIYVPNNIARQNVYAVMIMRNVQPALAGRLRGIYLYLLRYNNINNTRSEGKNVVPGHSCGVHVIR